MSKQPILIDVREFSLSPDAGLTTLHMGPATVLSVAWSGPTYREPGERSIRLFALVTHTREQMQPRSFRVLATATPMEHGEQTYVGTAIDEQGNAWHVFEVMG